MRPTLGTTVLASTLRNTMLVSQTEAQAPGSIVICVMVTYKLL